MNLSSLAGWTLEYHNGFDSYGQKELQYNKSMEEVIKEEIENVKKIWNKDGIKYNEKDVRLEVYENLRDWLKVEMSDVSY